MDQQQPVKARVFKNKWFLRFARRQGIEDRDLCEAVARAERGLIDADLGGGVIKQRIARPQEGRSGGFRSILLFQAARHVFFVYGFAKNRRDNISAADLKLFKRAAEVTLVLDEAALRKLTDSGELSEVNFDEEENLQK
jgi:hypothetical protein